MPIQLTTVQTLTNGTRLVLDKRRMLEDEKIFTCVVQMRTATGGTPADAIVSDLDLEVRGPQGSTTGQATVVARNTLASGQRIGALLKYNPQIAVNQTQWDALVTAYKASLSQLEALLLSAGYIHSSLTGT